jgi:hypothetical protein
MNEPIEPSKRDRKRGRYLSYLLRLWSTEPSESGYWLASLEDLHTGRRIGFANLEELFAYLIGLARTAMK